MKTHVIHLDPHDDLISIRDRMEWAKTPRILLIWPKRGRVEVRPLDLTLLRRHAKTLGAELGIVTRNGEIRAAARELGLPLFSSAAKAQKQPWVSRQPASLKRTARLLDLRAMRRALAPPGLFPWLQQPLVRLSVFALGVLAVLAVMLVFIPSAEVNLKLPEQQQSLEISVTADPAVEKVQISGLIPAHSLTLLTSGSATALATGQTSVPDQAASGECLLTNLTSAAVTLPVGTLLSTSGTPPVTFETLVPLEVPAKKGKTASVAIRAVTAGTAGNLPAGAINRIDGLPGQSLTVTNPQHTRGGTEIFLELPTAQDRESLRKRLLADLEREARSQFSAQIAGAAGDLLLPATLTRLQVVEESLSPSPGQAGKKLSLKLKVEFGVSYAAAVDLQELAGRVLAASLPAGLAPLPGQIEIQPTSQLVLGQGQTRWQMRATRTVRAAIDPGEVISLVLGKTARRAGSQLTERYQLEQPPVIQIQPSGWPWLPFLPLRIVVTG